MNPKIVVLAIFPIVFLLYIRWKHIDTTPMMKMGGFALLLGAGYLMNKLLDIELNRPDTCHKKQS